MSCNQQATPSSTPATAAASSSANVAPQTSSRATSPPRVSRPTVTAMRFEEIEDGEILEDANSDQPVSPVAEQQLGHAVPLAAALGSTADQYLGDHDLDEHEVLLTPDHYEHEGQLDSLASLLIDTMPLVDTEQGRARPVIRAARRAGQEGGFDSDLVHGDHRGFDAKMYFSGRGKRKSHYQPSRPSACVIRWNDTVCWGSLDNDATEKSFLRVSFGTSGHMPFIKLLVGMTPNTDVHPSYIYIFGSNLSLPDPIVARTSDGAGLSNEIQSHNVHKAVNDPTFERLMRDNRLTRMTMNLLGHQTDASGRTNVPVIVGNVSEASLQEWSKSENWSSLTPPQQVLAEFYCNRAAKLEIIYGYNARPEKQAAETAERKAFCQYFEAAMQLTARLGNFWWFRQQSELDWMDITFPFADLAPPRWQIQAWQQKENVHDAALPVLWSSTATFLVWPHKQERMFYMRLAVVRERAYGTVYVQQEWDRLQDKVTAKFRRSPVNPSQYIVEIWVSTDTEIVRKLRPQLETNMILEVQNGPILQGIVVDSLVPTTAAFVAYLTSNTLFDYEPGTDYKVTLKFPNEPTTYKRQITAQFVLDVPRRPRVGYSLEGLLLHAPNPQDSSPRYLSDLIRSNPQMLAEFEGQINSSRFNLDDAQKTAARGMIASQTGVCVIRGPPGTGKTTTLIALIFALAACRIKMVVCSPTNSGIESLVKAMMKYSKAPRDTHGNILPGRQPTPHAGLYCLFKGATATHESMRQSSAQKEQNKEAVEKEIDAYYLDLARLGNESALEFHKQSYAYKRHRYVQCTAAGDNPALGPHEAYHVEEAKEYLQLIQQRQLSQEDRQRFKVLMAEMDRRFLSEFVLVVFTTCNSAGHNLLTGFFKPDVCLADEAGCATPAEIAVPLAAHASTLKAVVLAGDSQQQSPTVMSLRCNEAGPALSTSILDILVDKSHLCIRLEHRPLVVQLRTQYRMHPSIMEWSNMQIYKSTVVNAPNVIDETSGKRQQLVPFLKPFNDYFADDAKHCRLAISIDESYSKKHEHTTSLHNEGEAKGVCLLADALLAVDQISPVDILIITPYTDQRHLIKRYLLTECTHRSAHEIKVVSTVNCQGHEAAVVIISLVKNDQSHPGNVRFIANAQQLNVELTRGRDVVLVVGAWSNWMHALAKGDKALLRNKDFKSLLEHVYRRNDVIALQDWVDKATGREPTLTRTASQRLPEQWVVSFGLHASSKPVDPLNPATKRPRDHSGD